jgi:hypothetical protein
LLQDPEQALGSFEQLPESARRAMLQAIRDRETWRLNGHRLGEWHLGLVRLMFGLRNRVSRSSRPGSLIPQVADAAAFAARRAPADLIHGLSALSSRLSGAHSRRPTLSALFSAAGIDPRVFSVCYARPIEQIEDCRGYWYEAAQHRAFGIVVGVDLVPTGDGSPV